jgi:hypothetical protein
MEKPRNIRRIIWRVHDCDTRSYIRQLVIHLGFLHIIAKASDELEHKTCQLKEHVITDDSEDIDIVEVVGVIFLGSESWTDPSRT